MLPTENKIFRLLLLSILLWGNKHNYIYSQPTSISCNTSVNICANALNTYPSTVSVGSAETGPNYGCLLSARNPCWFHFRVEQPGNLRFTLWQERVSDSMYVDIDFVLWGPFDSHVAPCSNQLTLDKIIDCSYGTANVEYPDISYALSGKYYILMTSNYANAPATTNILFQQSQSVGTIACSESCVTTPFCNTPVCADATLQLLATDHYGLGDYFWKGPDGFTSSLQNPIISDVNSQNSGYYYLSYTRDSTCSTIDSILVLVDSCGPLKGKVFTDVNNNCDNDSTEIGLSNVQLKLTQNGVFIAFSWTDDFGFYHFDVAPGSYTIEVVPMLNRPITCQTSLPHTVTVSSDSITYENFAIDCGQLDVTTGAVSVSGIAFFPGRTKSLCADFQAIGPNCHTTAIPCQFVLIIDSLLRYTPANTYPLPDIHSPSPLGDTLRWSIVDVADYQHLGSSSFRVSYTTKTTATIGDTVRITSVIYPFSGDVDTLNNYYLNSFIVGNSYDPNNKSVLPSGDGIDGLIPITVSKLEYTINFQNKGTAPAQNVIVLDTLHPSLDISSLMVTSASHTCSTTVLPGNILQFSFNNIMLPDSMQNEPDSRGYIRYSIAPYSGLVPGDQILNSASIYFDFNAPIKTNTTVNTISPPNALIDYEETNVFVSPNPTKGAIKVSFSNTMQIVKIKLVDVMGNSIYDSFLSEIPGGYSKNFDLSNNAPGIYILSIITDRKVISKKIIRN